VGFALIAGITGACVASFLLSLCLVDPEAVAVGEDLEFLRHRSVLQCCSLSCLSRGWGTGCPMPAPLLTHPGSSQRCRWRPGVKALPAWCDPRGGRVGPVSSPAAS